MSDLTQLEDRLLVLRDKVDTIIQKVGNPYHDKEGKFTTGPGGKISSRQDQPVPKTLVHYASDTVETPALSTRSDRLIPNSLSFSPASSASSIWGNKRFVGKLKSTAKVLHVDVEGRTRDFYNFGSDGDSPQERGAKLADWARKQGYDAIKMTNVPFVGTEIALLNLAAADITYQPLKPAKPIVFDRVAGVWRQGGKAVARVNTMSVAELEAKARALAGFKVKKTFDPNEPRDAAGRWTEAGGGGAKGKDVLHVPGTKSGWLTTTHIDRAVNLVRGATPKAKDAIASVAASIITTGAGLQGTWGDHGTDIVKHHLRNIDVTARVTAEQARDHLVATMKNLKRMMKENVSKAEVNADEKLIDDIIGTLEGLEFDENGNLVEGTDLTKLEDRLLVLRDRVDAVKKRLG